MARRNSSITWRASGSGAVLQDEDQIHLLQDGSKYLYYRIWARRRTASCLRSSSPAGVGTGIIDELELIEIKIAQDMLALCLLLHSSMAWNQTRFKRLTIDQTGERIMCCLVCHLASHVNNVGYVAKDQHSANDGSTI